MEWKEAEEGGMMCPLCKGVMQDRQEGDFCENCNVIAKGCDRCYREKICVLMYLKSWSAPDETRYDSEYIVHELPKTFVVGKDDCDIIDSDQGSFYWICDKCGYEDEQEPD